MRWASGRPGSYDESNSTAPSQSWSYDCDGVEENVGGTNRERQARDPSSVVGAAAPVAVKRKPLLPLVLTNVVV